MVQETGHSLLGVLVHRGVEERVALRRPVRQGLVTCSQQRAQQANIVRPDGPAKDRVTAHVPDARARPSGHQRLDDVHGRPFLHCKVQRSLAVQVLHVCLAATLRRHHAHAADPGTRWVVSGKLGRLAATTRERGAVACRQRPCGEATAPPSCPPSPSHAAAVLVTSEHLAHPGGLQAPAAAGSGPGGAGRQAYVHAAPGSPVEGGATVVVLPVGVAAGVEQLPEADDARRSLGCPAKREQAHAGGIASTTASGMQPRTAATAATGCSACSPARLRSAGATQWWTAVHPPSASGTLGFAPALRRARARAAVPASPRRAVQCVRATAQCGSDDKP